MADKTFRLVKRFVQSLDNAKYMNGQPISWSGTVVEYTVSDWDNVKVLDKADIQEKALLYGLEEFP